jgi:transposase InsO family protein
MPALDHATLRAAFEYPMVLRHLELHARNREVVRILFVLDACDREIIAWSAVANAGISGEMVRDLMVAAVERRFKGTCTPHPVEWLSDTYLSLVRARRRFVKIAHASCQGIFSATPLRG